MEKKYHHGSHSKYLLKYHFVFCVKYRKKLLWTKVIDDEIKRLFYEIAGELPTTLKGRGFLLHCQSLFLH